jgi:dihydroorotase
MRIILKNFRLVDKDTDTSGSIIVQDGIISEVSAGSPPPDEKTSGAAMIIDGKNLSSSDKLPVLMPAFVDLHAHFRDPGPGENNVLPSGVQLPSEMIESACMAAAAGGFGTVVCMANTKPAIDTIEKAAALKKRSDALGLVDLYPVLSLTKNMEGKELSEIKNIYPGNVSYIPLMLSEDGKDPENDELFLVAMKEAKRIGIPISCHCDLGGDESNAVRRVIALGKKAGCRIHIAHVSTKKALYSIREAKREIATAFGSNDGFVLSCEAMPHHLCLTEADAIRLGAKTWGKVSPSLRPEEDRQALIQALKDGTVDAIATDHAPHSAADKEAGSPGFSGFETAFASLYTELVCGSASIDIKRLSSLLSAKPARLLGFGNSPKRGRLLPDCTADLVIADTEAAWVVDSEKFFSRGKNSPFAGRQLQGRVLMTLHGGRVVFN